MLAFGCDFTGLFLFLSRKVIKIPLEERSCLNNLQFIQRNALKIAIYLAGLRLLGKEHNWTSYSLLVFNKLRSLQHAKFSYQRPTFSSQHIVTYVHVWQGESSTRLRLKK